MDDWCGDRGVTGVAHSDSGFQKLGTRISRLGRVFFRLIESTTSIHSTRVCIDRVAKRTGSAVRTGGIPRASGGLPKLHTLAVNDSEASSSRRSFSF